MKLIQPPFPNPVGKAGYFYVHAGHRRTAIDHAREVIRRSSAQELAEMGDDPLMAELAAPVGEWVIESLIQGAWMREFHEWEKATKAYFEGQHARNGSSCPDWKAPLPQANGPGSHIERVKLQLGLFAAAVSSEALEVIDAQRRAINQAKHAGEHFATEADYDALVAAVLQFWLDLDPQEAFNAGR